MSEMQELLDQEVRGTAEAAQDYARAEDEVCAGPCRCDPQDIYPADEDCVCGAAEAGGVCDCAPVGVEECVCDAVCAEAADPKHACQCEGNHDADVYDVLWVQEPHGGEVRGVILQVAVGGPNIWVDSYRKEARGYWGSRYSAAPLTDDQARRLTEYFGQ